MVIPLGGIGKKEKQIMCVITNENHEVVSISLIPGLGFIPNGYHCYFPVKDIPAMGSIFKG